MSGKRCGDDCADPAGVCAGELFESRGVDDGVKLREPCAGDGNKLASFVTPCLVGGFCDGCTGTGEKGGNKPSAWWDGCSVSDERGAPPVRRVKGTESTVSSVPF